MSPTRKSNLQTKQANINNIKKIEKKISRSTKQANRKTTINYTHIERLRTRSRTVRSRRHRHGCLQVRVGLGLELVFAFELELR